ncbi:unnamed protein product [Phaeothamnion confervicola]
MNETDRNALESLYHVTSGPRWRTQANWASVTRDASPKPTFEATSSTKTSVAAAASDAAASPMLSKNPFAPPQPQQRPSATNPFAPHHAAVGKTPAPNKNPFAGKERPSKGNPFAPTSPSNATGIIASALPVRRWPTGSTMPSPATTTLVAGTNLTTATTAAFSTATTTASTFPSTSDVGGGSSSTGGSGRSAALPPRPFGVQLSRGGRVRELRLDDNGLEGVLPDAIGALDALRHCRLSQNRLAGGVPDSFGECSALQWLSLAANRLSGPVPASLGGLLQLIELDLSQNQLSGPIPASLGGLANLQTLSLEHNQLSGPIPAELGRLSRLVYLRLSHNRLDGRIPDLAGLKSAQELWLNGNALSGKIPASLGRELPALRVLVLRDNLLRGALPDTLVRRLGRERVLTAIAPGNRGLSDPDTALLLHARPLASRLDRGLLLLSGALGYVDLATDAAAATTFYVSGRIAAFGIAVVFLTVPTLTLAAAALLAPEGGGGGSGLSGSRRRVTDSKRCQALLIFGQLHLAHEVWRGIREGQETMAFKTARFLEAVLEAAPQLLLQSYILAASSADDDDDDGGSNGGGNGGGPSAVVVVSVVISLLSLAWETANTLDRGWVEEEDARRRPAVAKGTPAWRAALPRARNLFCVWLFHVAEIAGRGISLVALALAAGWWTPLCLAFSMAVRLAIGLLTEQKDLPLFKVVIKALASVLLDTVWDHRRAYHLAAALSAAECAAYLAVAVTLRESRLGVTHSLQVAALATAGAAWGLRILLDILVRQPLHWSHLDSGSGVGGGAWPLWIKAAATTRGSSSAVVDISDINDVGSSPLSSEKAGGVNATALRAVGGSETRVPSPARENQSAVV